MAVRRLRRTTFVTDDKTWIFHQRLRVDLETGVGLASGQGIDPQLMLRWSDDGGHTWSNEKTVSAGKIGAFRHRAIWNRLGRSRQRVYEVSTSDPVNIVFIGAELDLAKGTH